MDIKPGNIFRQIQNDSCVYKSGDLRLVYPHTETVFDDGYCRYIVRKLIESITNKDDDLRLADVFSLGKPRHPGFKTLLLYLFCILDRQSSLWAYQPQYHQHPNSNVHGCISSVENWLRFSTSIKFWFLEKCFVW